MRFNDTYKTWRNRARQYDPESIVRLALQILGEPSANQVEELGKAQTEISIAIDLAATLRAFLTSDTNDARIDESMTADTIVELIENHMRKIRDRLETHSSRHTNLFFAYFDLKAAGGAS